MTAADVSIGGGGRSRLAIFAIVQKLTGLDPRNQKNEHESVMFALDWAKQHGWYDFHGAANSGIGDRQGIGDVHIDQIVVQTHATDANGIARDIGGAVRRNLSANITTQANTGLN